MKGVPDNPGIVLRDFHGEEAGIGHIAVSKVAKFSKYPIHRQDQRQTEVLSQVMEPFQRLDSLASYVNFEYNIL